MNDELDSLRRCVVNDAVVISRAADELQMWRDLVTRVVGVLEKGVLPLLDETNGPTIMAKVTLEVTIEKLREALL